MIKSTFSGARWTDTFKGGNAGENILPPFWKGVFYKRKEFASFGSKFFPFRVGPFLSAVKQIGNHKVVSLIKMVENLASVSKSPWYGFCPSPLILQCLRMLFRLCRGKGWSGLLLTTDGTFSHGMAHIMLLAETSLRHMLSSCRDSSTNLNH